MNKKHKKIQPTGIRIGNSLIKADEICEVRVTLTNGSRVYYEDGYWDSYRQILDMAKLKYVKKFGCQAMVSVVQAGFVRQRIV